MKNCKIKGCEEKSAIKGLCKSHYQKQYIQNNKEKIDEKKMKHQNEITFIRNFFHHDNWLYESVIFRLNREKYTPDFYDGERNVFIEVAGTRQAYHSNKEKYKLLIKIFPKIKFEIRKPDGSFYEAKTKPQAK